MKNDGSDDFRRANGAVKIAQEGLIGLINTGKTGLSIKATDIGNRQTGEADDIFYSGSRKAIEELLVRSWRHTGFNDDQIADRLKTHRRMDGEDRSCILKYMQSRGIPLEDKNLQKFFDGIDRMKQDVGFIKIEGRDKPVGMSLYYQTFTQFKPIINPSQITAPAKLKEHESVTQKRNSPESIKVNFSSNAGMHSESMSFAQYRVLVTAGNNRNISFHPRMEDFEDKFIQTLKARLKEKNIDTTDLDVSGLAKSLLRSGTVENQNDIAKLDKNKAMKDAIISTMNKIAENNITIAISTAAYKAEKPSALRVENVINPAGRKPDRPLSVVTVT